MWKLTLGYGNEYVKSSFDLVGKHGSQLKVLKRCIVLIKHKGGSLHNKKKISNCFTSSRWSKQRVVSTFEGHPLLMYLMKWIHATLPKKNSNFQLKLCILYKQDY